MHVEIARYLTTEAPRVDDPVVFARVITAASPFRYPAIFDAALALAGDRSAPVNAQLLGWFTLAVEHGQSLHLRELGGTPRRWFAGTASTCDWSEPTGAEYTVDHPLSADHVTQLAELAARVSADPGYASKPRAFAKCILRLTEALLPDAVPPAGSVELSHLCGTVFEVTNHTDRAIAVRWTLSGDAGDEGELTVPAGGRTRFDTMASGTVRLFVGDSDSPVATASTTTPCIVRG